MKIALLLEPKVAALAPGTELMPHQERVVEALSAPGRQALLAYHGLGTGKTLTSIAAADALGSSAHAVTPAPLQENFRKELGKFAPSDAAFDVRSYNKAVGTPVDPHGLTVIDEAHNLTSPGTARGRILEDARAAEKLLMLSATPIRNYPHELGPLINALHGDKVVPEDEEGFNRKFMQDVVVHDPGFLRRWLLGEPVVTEKAPANLGRLRKLLEGHVDYQPSGGKEFFPEVRRETIQVPMSSRQQATYEAVAKQFPQALMFKIRHLLPPGKRDLDNLNAFLTAARQVSNTPTGYNVSATDLDSPKIQRAVEELKKRLADRRAKAVVYSNYLASGVYPYARQLEAAGIPYGIFTGDTKPAERAKLVEDYNKAKIRALLISGAGSEGLDLKGTRLMQLLEPHWQNVRLNQAVGRTARYKSHSHLPAAQRNVDVQQFISTLNPTLWQRMGFSKTPASADEYLAEVARRKAELNEKYLQVLREVGTPADAPGR